MTRTYAESTKQKPAAKESTPSIFAPVQRAIQSAPPQPVQRTEDVEQVAAEDPVGLESPGSFGYSIGTLSLGASAAPAIRAIQAKRIAGRLPTRDLHQGLHTTQLKAEPAPNRTGMPDTLKTGVESLSGMSLDHVKVHYNSDKPSQLGALAYAQGSEIHVSPGQERHLPHEAWHVVQQAQGRVKPTMQMKDGVAVNDDTGLEHEADVMGARALKEPQTGCAHTGHYAHRPGSGGAVQRTVTIGENESKIKCNTKGSNATKALILDLKEYAAQWKHGWITGFIKKYVLSDDDFEYKNIAELAKELQFEWDQPKDDKKKATRPSFPRSAKRAGRVGLETLTGRDQSRFSPSRNDAALPHRFPYSAIWRRTTEFVNKGGDKSELIKWSDRLLEATKSRLELNEKWLKENGDDEMQSHIPAYKKDIEGQIENFASARENLLAAASSGASTSSSSALTMRSKRVKRFLYVVNGLSGNIPDYGPHNEVNNRVSDRLHLHVGKDGRLTPGSDAAVSMTPHDELEVAMTADGEFLVTTDGVSFDLSKLTPEDRARVEKHKKGPTKITQDELTGEAMETWARNPLEEIDVGSDQDDDDMDSQNQDVD